MRPLYWISLILVIVGALNWGLIGLFEFDLVATLFGTMTVLTRIVYSLVGLAGLVVLGLALSFESRGSTMTMAR